MAQERNELELAEAAELLGVHPSTLRRWADSGKISYTRTLSGRRRFLRTALENARGEMNQPSPVTKPEQFESKTLNLARQRTSDLSNRPEDWTAHLSEDQRLLFRYSGQRLLGLMMQFISRMDGAETFLDEGRRVAGDYGRICYKAGLSVSQTAEVFLYFRRSILESVQTTAGLSGPNDQDGHRIFLRTVDFFDLLLVATIESHSKMNQQG